MSQTAEVIRKDANQIVEFNQFETQLMEFKERYDNVVYDLDDPAQDKQARSDRLAIGKVISKLDTTHKEIKAPLKAKTDLIDAERKRIKDDLLDIQGKIKSQIAEHERKIQEHAEMLQDKVDSIEAFGAIDESQTNAFRIKELIEKLESTDIDDSYEHRKADATLAKVDALKKLNLMLEAVVKREEEQAELERLRREQEERERAERERKIAEEARRAAEAEAEKERKRLEQAAERALKEKEELAARAEQEKIEAIERERKAAEDREKERIEAEKQAKVEAEAEALRRENNKKHNAKINNDAKKCFMDGGMDEASATLAVTLIAKKLVKHVVITY